MKICKDGRIWGQNNKKVGTRLGILSGKGKYIPKWISCPPGKYIRTTEFRIKASEIRKGEKSPLFGKSAWNKGKSHSEKAIKKIREASRRQNNPNWKGGITSLSCLIRGLDNNKKWIKNVFERDNYTCQDCFIRGVKLNAHHKKSFAIIFQEFLQEYNQFSPMEDKETLVRLAITYEPFWDADNGKTLCEDCHNLTKGGVRK